MKRAISALMICLAAHWVVAQPSDPEIKIGERFTLQSKVLDEERPYWVYLPGSYGSGSNKRYPVLYLLDGDAHFHSASGVVQFMSSGINGNLQIPELIIVAIPNTDRTRDLTPTHTMLGRDGKEDDFLKASGGGDRFLQFIREELFPKIDSSYRTLPYRILVGHSFGGLLALHALLNAQELFQGYIAIDPSVWWDNQVLVHQAEGRFQTASKRPLSVYISLANNPELGFGDPKIDLAAGRGFAGILQSASSPTLRSRLQFLEKEDHGSAPLVSLYQGLLFIFDGYKPPLKELFDDPTILEPHYKKVSERVGVELLPPEPLVNQLGYMMLYRRQSPDKAIEFFRFNVAHYPDSANAYDSLAEGYMVKGEKALAIENYEKSLKLDPNNDNAVKRLEELKGQQR